VVVSSVVVLLGVEEDVEEIRAGMVSTVAKFARRGWPGARVNAHRRSCCGRKLRVAVALLESGRNQGPKYVSRVRGRKREVVGEEGWREKSGLTGIGDGDRRCLRASVQEFDGLGVSGSARLGEMREGVEGLLKASSAWARG
jgi:hypothetical protein